MGPGRFLRQIDGFGLLKRPAEKQKARTRRAIFRGTYPPKRHLSTFSCACQYPGAN